MTDRLTPPATSGALAAELEDAVFDAARTLWQESKFSASERLQKAYSDLMRGRLVVPVEPTAEMVRAGMEFEGKRFYGEAEVRNIYKDMLEKANG